MPSARPSSAAASVVMDATRRTPPASSATLAVASPLVMLVTFAEILLRALSRMVSAPIRSREVAVILPQRVRPRPHLPCARPGGKLGIMADTQLPDHGHEHDASCAVAHGAADAVAHGHADVTAED